MLKKRIATAALAAAMLAGTLAGCGDKVQTLNIDDPTITILCSQEDVESATKESPVWQALEEHLGAKLDISWVPASSYGEKLTATLGSGNYPMVLLIDSKSSSIIQNARAGTFWEIGDKITDASKYPNLSQANPIVLNNISIDGKVYGLYRARTLGRNGVSIRKDWLDNLNLDMPTTIDEFYNVLKAFKEDDPDGNGQDDTFGMIMTTATTSFDNLSVWFGAPNKYGIDEATGDLVPAHLTDEYLETMKFIKKLYDEQLINQDMATYDGTKWDEQFLSGKAGVIIDVADRARRLATNIADKDPKADVGVFGYLKKDANSEARTLPTTGYAGWFAFPKKALPNEEDIEFVLGVMDKMNDQEALNLVSYGIEGRQYEIVDGFAEVTTDKNLTKEFGDLNKISTAIVEQKLIKTYANKTAEQVDVVYKDNVQYAVANPAEALISDTYSRKGPQLDAIINEARTRFIVGQITEEQWKSEIERWKTQGGNDVIKEMNEQYKAINK